MDAARALLADIEAHKPNYGDWEVKRIAAAPDEAGREARKPIAACGHPVACIVTRGDPIGYETCSVCEQVREAVAAAEEAAHDESAQAMWTAWESNPGCAQGMYEAAKCYPSRTGALARALEQVRRAERERCEKIIESGVRGWKVGTAEHHEAVRILAAISQGAPVELL